MYNYHYVTSVYARGYGVCMCVLGVCVCVVCECVLVVCACARVRVLVELT